MAVQGDHMTDADLPTEEEVRDLVAGLERLRSLVEEHLHWRHFGPFGGRWLKVTDVGISDGMVRAYTAAGVRYFPFEELWLPREKLRERLLAERMRFEVKHSVDDDNEWGYRP